MGPSCLVNVKGLGVVPAGDSPGWTLFFPFPGKSCFMMTEPMLLEL